MILTFNPIPLRKIKLVIFDLDGTLVDSKLDLATSVNAMLFAFRSTRYVRFCVFKLQASSLWYLL